VLTEWVPVKLAGQTTRFAFSYTVTSDDKATGKVTFRADANIVDHRDALPADNELQSTPISPAAGGRPASPSRLRVRLVAALPERSRCHPSRRTRETRCARKPG
jgi:hypothetical protein